MKTDERDPEVLAEPEWRTLAQAHRDRWEALTAGHRERRARAIAHPVEDFLFTYYSYKPAVLRRWHPGEGVELAGAARERAGERWYLATAEGGAVVDAAAFRDEKRTLIRGIRAILAATQNRSAGFGCFGLHEWAMVYRANERRHRVPLRLGQTATDAVVDAAPLRCTHFDAFRFFTDDAAPRNRETLTRARQAETEQPGCLHANMDLYKWAVKLGPLVPGALLLDAFELAADIRRVDMRASPYDLRDWGYDPIPVETVEGKAAYVAAQRRFADRAALVRQRLLTIVDGQSTAAQSAHGSSAVPAAAR